MRPLQECQPAMSTETGADCASLKKYHLVNKTERNFDNFSL